MSVHQESIYYIDYEFETALEVVLAKEYLDMHQPTCTECEWLGKGMNLSGFDSEYVAQQFEKDLVNYVDNQK